LRELLGARTGGVEPGHRPVRRACDATRRPFKKTSTIHLAGAVIDAGVDRLEFPLVSRARLS
jgi:hypothetical protein